MPRQIDADLPPHRQFRRTLLLSAALSISGLLWVHPVNAQSPGAPGFPPNGTKAAQGPGVGSATSESPIETAKLLSGFMEPFDYDPRGRRDPFVQPLVEKPVGPGSLHGPVLPLQRFELSELKLIGIIWDVTKPRIMIRDPDNKVHIIGRNARLGRNNGYVAVIREGEVVVVETVDQEGKLLSSARVLKIQN